MTREGAGDPALGQRAHLSTRAKSRKRAVDILFEADLRDADPVERLAEHELHADPAVRPYTGELVRGVARRREEIDAAVEAALTSGWTLQRMPRVDRTLARVATYELLAGEVPVNVVVSEATQLATELSTDNSPAFLNGLLGRIAQHLAAPGA